MLETIMPFVYIYFGTAISLGVGSSSVVIAGFLTALADGKIDEGERRMLGVIYWSLRIAMVSIAVTLLLLFWAEVTVLASLGYCWLLTFVLFANAGLMTKHYISSKIGPALQAATWYTLGFIVTIDMFSLYTITPQLFFYLYLADIVIAIAIVNTFLKILTTKK